MSLRLLTFSTLYPNDAQPGHGIFVETRLRNLVADFGVQSTVLAPVPYFPFRSRIFGSWGRYAQAMHHETRYGLEVFHPRYPVIPRFGMSAAPILLYQSAARVLSRLIRQGLEFDAIDGHYIYPDGVAAVWLGKRFAKPVVLTARGSDISQLPNYTIPRWYIRRTVAAADGLIAVSEAIKSGLIAVGAEPARITVLRNGVDTGIFRPLDPIEARAELGITRPTLLSVGHLIERKGHDRVIAAMPLLADLKLDLVILGDGPERGRLLAQISELGLEGRVRLVGSQAQSRLPLYYSAASALVLASSREGWANVLLESMACGTPVVASNAWGNAEVVASRDAGRIFYENTPAGIAAGVRGLLADPPTRAATRAYAEDFGWKPTSRGQFELFKRIVAARTGGAEAELRTQQSSISGGSES